MIDEAKQLDPSGGNFMNVGGVENYQKQACESLTNGISEGPSDQCVIMCGYKEEMESLFQSRYWIYLNTIIDAAVEALTARTAFL